MTITSHEEYSAWKGWDQKDFGNPSREQCAYCEAELGPYISDEQARVLELGFGNGSLLGWCRECGHDCMGVELSPVLVTKALKAGFNAVASLAEARNRNGDHSFDLAVAFDIFEHIPASEILGVLKEIHMLLKPGALLVISFPNGDSPFGRAHQHGDITHVTALGSGKIKWFATQAGFNVERLKEPAVPLRGEGVLRICKRLSAKAIRLIVDLLISYAYFSGAVRVFSASLVVILRASESALRPDDRTDAMSHPDADTNIQHGGNISDT
jgi:SAM-dependent methyltransferase